MTMEDKGCSPLEESLPRSSRSGHAPDLGGLARRIAALEGDNAELRNTNADLVEFASLAAHELRSPLQTVTGYAELLGAEIGEALSEDGHKYLERLLQSASRMQDLVDALLVHARLGTTVRQRTDVQAGLWAKRRISRYSYPARHGRARPSTRSRRGPALRRSTDGVAPAR